MRAKLAWAVLVGVAMGIAGASAVHAWQLKPAHGYVIAEVEVTDPETMKQYGAKVPETLAPFQYQYIIRDGKPKSLEGEPPKGGVVVLEFDSVEQAQAWWDSPAYDAIKPLRQKAASSRIFLAQGVAPKP